MWTAKLASDTNKPVSLTVTLTEEAKGMLGLPVEAFPMIGPATARRLHELNVYTGADLKVQTLEGLKNAFSKAGEHSTTSPTAMTSNRWS